MAARGIRPRGSRSRHHRRRRAGREAARGDSARRCSTERDARARLLRVGRACRVHGARLHRGRSCRRVALSGRTPEHERSAALRALEAGELRVVFSVDVLGEGVDVPSVDTVLLLRPTDSATVFTQQLGRGLRRAEGKPYLTVIDLIGQQHREFRFDRRLERDRRPPARAARAAARGRVPVSAVRLPRRARPPEPARSCSAISVMRRGCRSGRRWSTICAGCPARRLLEFLEADRPRRRRRLPTPGPQLDAATARRRRAAFARSAVEAEERDLLRALRRMLNIDDPERVRFYRELLARTRPPKEARLDERERRLLLMLHYDLWGTRRTFSRPRRVIARALVARVRSRGASASCSASSTNAAATLARPSGLRPEIPLARPRAIHARRDPRRLRRGFAGAAPCSFAKACATSSPLRRTCCS